MQWILATGLRAEGISSLRSEEIARAFRTRYVDGSLNWRLSPDVIPVLTCLSNEGWRHVILSNHVPELPAIIDGVGLGKFVDRVISSAAVGYEKPHPAIFELARALSGNPQQVWMVGDNQQADVDGAHAVGIPAILVQHPDRPLAPGALSLLEVEGTICE